jgi:NAD+ synthase (glutamine-hydrolysing)
MMSALRVAIAQINTVVGDLDGNVGRATAAIEAAAAADADVVVLPELTVTGYPVEDLVLKPGFVRASKVAMEKVAASTGSCVAIVGFVDGEGDDVWNGLAVCAHGRVVGVYHKRCLPNYDVFDELRTFRAGAEPHQLYEIAGVAVGVTICEDAWIADGPVTELARGGAQVIVNINGSPFAAGKVPVREKLLRDRISEGGVPIVYANLVGGQDDLVFDGGSMVLDGSGRLIARAERFVENLLVMDMPATPTSSIEPYPRVAVTTGRESARPPVESPMAAVLDPSEELWRALVLGTRDYVHKNGFRDVCLGVSGGIDSSLVATLAVDALGAEHVHAVLMPSRFSSEHSVADAERLCANLGIDSRTIPIEAAHRAFLEMLEPSFGDLASDVTEENIQSRIRGVVLMALANKFGWLVLTTGNKSELAVGYSTLYGDTAGAYACIKDVWKTTVYELCRWRNEQAGFELIPESVLTKVPSAELRPDQRDDESLPPYDVLDPILVSYVEDDLTVAEILAMDLAPAETVRRMCRLVDIAEYKRRQSPVGVRVSQKAFGRDRRIPMTNHFRG